MGIAQRGRASGFDAEQGWHYQEMSRRTETWTPRTLIFHDQKCCSGGVLGPQTCRGLRRAEEVVGYHRSFGF